MRFGKYIKELSADRVMLRARDIARSYDQDTPWLMARRGASGWRSSAVHAGRVGLSLRGDTCALAERTAQATDLDVNYAKNGAASMRAA
jgi:hypothetical protein